MGSRVFFFFQAEDGIRDRNVTGVQTCALPISRKRVRAAASSTSLRERGSRQLRLIAERTLRRRPGGSEQACLEAPGGTRLTRVLSAEALAPLCQRKSWRSRGLLFGTRAWCSCYRESA